MNTTLLAFFIVAFISLVAAWRVITDPSILHAGLWMGLSFVGVAGIFLLLEAEFLAGVQVLVYVGAITTIILFGIMLSDVGEVRVGPEPPGWVQAGAAWHRGLRHAFPLLVAAGFAGTMLGLYTQSGWGQLRERPLELAGLSVGGIGRELFSTFALPFEIASLVLLAALLGAIVLAMREEER
ncbi:MAG: NADH-quinone oxidoreductase subunit J [Limnochordaceae bacterium]|nr:NADH-quinone oxidoreductase subunit J [Limnochordaceae bacterium]